MKIPLVGVSHQLYFLTPSSLRPVLFFTATFSVLRLDLYNLLHHYNSMACITVSFHIRRNISNTSLYSCLSSENDHKYVTMWPVAKRMGSKMRI
jgi:hypothetical protein